MITISIIALGLIITIVYLIRSINKSNTGMASITVKQVIIACCIFLGGSMLGLVQPLVAERVDAGHVGIKVWLTGDNRGISKYEYTTGWVIYNVWTSRLYEFPTYQQHIEYPPQQVITKGGFPATIKPSFNYSLKPGDVGDMFSNLRIDIKQVEQQWLQTAIVGTVNDVANRWTVDSVFNHREEFEANIVAEINKRTSKWFIISQLRTNIVPPEALQQAIIKKTAAIQDVQVAENEKLVAIAQGEKKIAQARADSAAAVIEAAGDAEVIKKKQLTLTPIYIEYIKAQTWDGKLPATMLGGSNGTMINLK